MQIESFLKNSIALGGFVCRTEVKRKRATKSRKKRGVTVPEIGFKCCNKEINDGQLWLLKDIKGFTARKLYTALCQNCHNPVVMLIEKIIEDGKVFHNLIRGKYAIRILYREKKRVVMQMLNVKADNLYGWIYGINKQIKNKKGLITKIKQFSSDFKGNKKLVKEYVYS